MLTRLGLSMLTPACMCLQWSFIRHKFSHPRFLDVLHVPPFSPHAGGSLFSVGRPDSLRASHSQQLLASPVGAPLQMQAAVPVPAADEEPAMH